jgi:hypothetical protein
MIIARLSQQDLHRTVLCLSEVNRDHHRKEYYLPLEVCHIVGLPSVIQSTRLRFVYLL